MPYYESEPPRSDLHPKGTTALWNGDEISPSKNAVLKAMEWRLSPQSKGPQSEPFCVMDLGYVHNQYEHWKKSLPAVTPFYGMFLP